MQDIFSRCIDINCRVGSLEKQGQLHKGFPYNWAAPEEETPEHCLLKKDRKEQVWKALNKLNETQRTLIVAHYIHNQTYDYISKKYGIEKSKVRRIIKRGLNVLRCLLE